MKWIKQAAALCALSLPVAAFAADTAGPFTVTHLFANNGFGDLIYVQLSGLTAKFIPCGGGKDPFFFVLPRSTAAQADMLTFLVSAKRTGRKVTLTGTGACDVDFTVETLGTVSYSP